MVRCLREVLWKESSERTFRWRDWALAAGASSPPGGESGTGSSWAVRKRGVLFGFMEGEDVGAGDAVEEEVVFAVVFAAEFFVGDDSADAEEGVDVGGAVVVFPSPGLRSAMARGGLVGEGCVGHHLLVAGFEDVQGLVRRRKKRTQLGRGKGVWQRVKSMGSRFMGDYSCLGGRGTLNRQVVKSSIGSLGSLFSGRAGR